MTRNNERFFFFSILDGASITNVDTASNPEYYGYTRPGGSWVIMRYNSSTEVYDFYIGADLDRSLTDYDDAWTNRSTLGYRRAGEFKDI